MRPPPPRKKGWGIHFWRNFSILTKNIFFRKKNFLATKGGNDGRREQRKEGVTGMILPRPNSKTWFMAHPLILYFLLRLYPLSRSPTSSHGEKSTSGVNIFQVFEWAEVISIIPSFHCFLILPFTRSVIPLFFLSVVFLFRCSHFRHPNV